MNDIYQEGTFMVFGWDAMPDTSKVVIADSVFNVASDVMNGDMTACLLYTSPSVAGASRREYDSAGDTGANL